MDAPTPMPLPEPARDAPALRRSRTLARLLDDLVRVPGTRFRVGLDPVLGLVPGLGDWLGWAVSADLLVAAVRLGAPASTLLRMAGNLVLDAVVGAIPLVGDLFDAAWKANRRNLALLERHAADPDATRRASTILVASVLIGTGLVLLASAWAAFWLLSWLVGLV